MSTWNMPPGVTTNDIPGNDLDSVDSMELLGAQVDTIENLLAAMSLPLPPQLHLDALRPALTSVAENLRRVYVSVTGDNPWHDA